MKKGGGEKSAFLVIRGIACVGAIVIIQRSAKKYANLAKLDPTRARQNR